jgi:hypothetical protein
MLAGADLAYAVLSRANLSDSNCIGAQVSWALPLLEYSSADTLLAAFENKVISPALEKLGEVRRRKALPPQRRSAED